MVKFNPATDIPDLSGKVVIVTGVVVLHTLDIYLGNIGLGYETILQLSKHTPKHIYLAARSKEKADSAISKLKSEVPNGAPVTFLPLDLSSFDSIKAAVKTFNDAEEYLDILVNNAGLAFSNPGLTKDGYEILLGTNHLGPQLFTELLLPTLKKTASEGRDVRVVNLTSNIHEFAPKQGYFFDKLKTDMSDVSVFQRYGQSKLAVIHATTHMAEQHPEILWVAVHPGSVRTNWTSKIADMNWFMYWLAEIFSILTQASVQKGALGQLWAATTKKEDVKQGGMYYPFAQLGKDTENAKDPKLRQKLVEWTEAELKAHV